MLCKCSGKYIDIYFILKITFYSAYTYLFNIGHLFFNIGYLFFMNIYLFFMNIYLLFMNIYVFEILSFSYSTFYL